MKISIWKKYHIISIASGFSLLVLFLLLSIFVHGLIGFISFLVLGFTRSFILHSIKCPRCGKPIDNWTTIFSGNNDGMFVPMSKTCRTCGYDFTEKEKDDEKDKI